jgi:hypothetical protein
MYDPCSEEDAFEHVADAAPVKTRGRGRPPSTPFASRCLARAAVRDALLSRGHNPDPVLRAAAGTVEDIEEVRTWRERLEKLESLLTHMDAARWTAKLLQHDMELSADCGRVLAHLDSSSFWGMCEAIQVEVRHTGDIPDSARKILYLEWRRVAVERLRVRAPSLVALGPTILALWEIASGLEAPIEIRGQPRSPGDREMEAFLHRHEEADRRPYATAKQAERSGELQPGKAASEMFAARVDAWEHVLGSQSKRARRIPRE